MLNLLNIIINFWGIVYPDNSESYINWSLSLFGVANGFSEIFLMILIPMSVAD